MVIIIAMLCQKQIDNFFDTSYGNKEIFFIKLRVQGLHKNPVKTASAIDAKIVWCIEEAKLSW